MAAGTATVGAGLEAWLETKGLTARQREIYLFIRSEIMDRGRPPSLRETMSHFGFTSTNSLRCHFQALKAKGVITNDRNRARSIYLAEPCESSEEERLRAEVARLRAEVAELRGRLNTIRAVGYRGGAR